MKTAIALLLAFLAFAAVMCVPVEGSGDFHTYVSNQADVAFTATIVYQFPGHSSFIDRTIQPRNYDSDVYTENACDWASNPGPVEIDLVLVGSSNSGGKVQVDCDASIVGIPSAGAGNGAVDIYESVYGDINTPKGYCLNTIRP